MVTYGCRGERVGWGTAILGCIRRSLASTSSGVILPLSSTLGKHHLGYCFHLWSPQHQNNIDLLE